MTRQAHLESCSFPSTRWSLIFSARAEDSPGRPAALEELLRLYLPPLRSHLLYRLRIESHLAEDLLQRMAANRADFTLTFRRLTDAAASPDGDAAVRTLYADPGVYDDWAAEWRERLNEEPADGQERAAAMRSVNPVFIPRNHLVEAALDAASRRQDFQPFEELLDAISRPYEERPGFERYAIPARPEESVLQTFCGT